MAKEFTLHVDVTMSGDIYIEAETKEEALEIFRNMNFVSSDLRGFYLLNSQLVDIKES